MSNSSSRMSCSVAANSDSVSPQNPTMMSVLNDRRGRTASRAARILARYSSTVYSRRMRRSKALSPACTGRCSCSQTVASSCMAVNSSGTAFLGCEVRNRSRQSPGTVSTARSSSGSREPVDGSRYELTFWPRRVTSVTPSAARSLTSATRSSKGRLTSLPRTAGTMQKAQVLSQPIWIVTQAA